MANVGTVSYVQGCPGLAEEYVKINGEDLILLIYQ